MKKLSIIGFLFGCVLGFSQNQFHMSQYMLHKAFINPAALKNQNNINGAIFHRSQWLGIEGAPVTQGFNINYPLKNNKSALGLTIVHDKIAINNHKEISSVYAHQFKTGENSRLVFGLGTTIGFYKSDFNQINVHDPNDPIFNTGTINTILPNFEFGSYYACNNFFLGFSIPSILKTHLITNSVSFESKNLHLFLNGGYKFNLNNHNYLNCSFLLKEITGAPIQLDVNLELIKEKYGFGLSLRSNKELLLFANCNLSKVFNLGYGYEMNFTEIGKISVGTHEVLIRFQLNNKTNPRPIINSIIN